LCFGLGQWCKMLSKLMLNLGQNHGNQGRICPENCNSEATLVDSNDGNVVEYIIFFI
jgi:hypothetical protein